MVEKLSKGYFLYRMYVLYMLLNVIIYNVTK